MTIPPRIGSVLAVLTIFVAACGEPGDRPEEADEGLPETTPVPGWVDDVADAANAIAERPAAADSILGAHDLTAAAFDSLLQEVAADPALTAAYEERRR